MRQQRMFDRLILGAMVTCVSDYMLMTRDESGEWREVARVAANFQRHNRVQVDSVRTTALRIQVQRTHGDELARIYEVRVCRESGAGAQSPA